MLYRSADHRIVANNKL